MSLHDGFEGNEDKHLAGAYESRFECLDDAYSESDHNEIEECIYCECIPCQCELEESETYESE